MSKSHADCQEILAAFKDYDGHRQASINFTRAYNNRTEARAALFDETELDKLKNKIQGDNNYNEIERGHLTKALSVADEGKLKYQKTINDANSTMSSIITQFTTLKNNVAANDIYDATAKANFTDELIRFDGLYQEV